MKLVINNGLSAQVVDIPLSGETIEELQAAGEIDDIGALWDILRGEAGDAPVAPLVVVPPSVNNTSVSEGETLTFTAGEYDGDEPLTITRVLRTNGTITNADFVGPDYVVPVTGTNRIITLTETVTNAAGSISEVVTINVARIPVAPSVLAAPSISPATPQQGDVLTIVPPTWTGDTPITVDFEATFNGTDVSGSVVSAGANLQYTPAVSGDFSITFSATNAAGGPVEATASVTVVSFNLVNTGLNINTADVMVQGESQAASWLYDTWAVDEDPARPSHAWSQLFRAAYTGSHFGPITGGAGPLAGGLPGIGNGTILGPDNSTYSTWNFGSFPANNDPRNNLNNFDALVLYERAAGGSNGEFSDPYRWTDRQHMLASELEFEGEWLYVERAAQQGIKSIFLAGPRQPMIEDGSTPSNGVRADWKAKAELTDTPLRVRQQFLQSRLVANGYSDVSVYIIPFHLMEIKLHDDVGNNDPVKPASISSYYDYHADDAGWVNNNGHHVYMHSRLGSYADWCLAYAVLFATSPVGLGNTIGSTSVTTDEAAYLQTVAWDIAQAYYPTGLGGDENDDVVWEPYLGENLVDLIAPNHTYASTPVSAKFSDIAGTTPAVESGPVGNIAGYVAASEGARPTLEGDYLDFSATPMTRTHTAFAPNYGIIITSINELMVEEECYFQATGGGSFSIRADFDNGAFGSIITMDYEGGWTFCGVPADFFDGRPIMIEWYLRPNGENTVLRVVDLNLTLESDFKFYRQIVTDRVLSGARTNFALGPDNGSETAEFGMYMTMATDTPPNDLERMKIYAFLENQFGGPLWFSDLYG